MKKILCICLISIILFYCSCYVSIYTRKAKVTNINKEVVTVIDKKGNIWEFKGNGFKKGQKVKLIMDTNNTDEKITDDFIKDVKVIKRRW